MPFQSRFAAQEKARHFWQTSSADTFKTTRRSKKCKKTAMQLDIPCGVFGLVHDEECHWAMTPFGLNC